MSEEFTIRPVNFRKDYDEQVSLLDLVFENELTAKGTTIRAILDEYKAMMPIFKFLGIFSKNFRHIMDGYLFENQEGKIIATVTVGWAGSHWEIAMVATHPDYRRRGLARKLVNKAIEHAKEYKAKMCVLEVLEENTPAYKLYRSLSFTHYDSMTTLKLEPDKLAAISKLDLPEGYVLGEWKRDKQTNQARYELAVRATPEEVSTFSPVNKNQYKNPLYKRLFRPLVMKIISSNRYQRTVYHNNVLVGTISARTGRSEKSLHKMDLVIDPSHSNILAEPMLNHALEFIKNNATLKMNIIITIRSADANLLTVLKKYGFVEIEKNHLLGLKLD